MELLVLKHFTAQLMIFLEPIFVLIHWQNLPLKLYLSSSLANTQGERNIVVNRIIPEQRRIWLQPLEIRQKWWNSWNSEGFWYFFSILQPLRPRKPHFQPLWIFKPYAPVPELNQTLSSQLIKITAIDLRFDTVNHDILGEKSNPTLGRSDSCFDIQKKSLNSTEFYF